MKPTLTARTHKGTFSIYGNALKLIGYKEGDALMFYLNRLTKTGRIEIEEKDKDNFEPRHKSLQPCRSFKSLPLYEHFKDCFGLTGDVSRFEISVLDGVIGFELIK